MTDEIYMRYLASAARGTPQRNITSDLTEAEVQFGVGLTVVGVSGDQL